MNKKLRISIVIPVYNEADYIGDCLEAIARQTVPAYEVIVVDNNSTDKTCSIAENFPFVRVLSESRQGVVYARTTGFNQATGDIIARIDGDTILPHDWLEKVTAIFADLALSAVAGQPDYYDFPLPRVANAIDSACRRWLANKLAGSHYLYGSNMAIRRSAWRQVRSYLCPPQPGMHEDFDVGIHLQQNGYKVRYDGDLKAGICSRRIDTPFKDYARYTLVSPRTYKIHHLRTGRYMYRIVAVSWLCYLPGRLIYRSFDTTTGTFSLSRLLTSSETRVDPTANVA